LFACFGRASRIKRQTRGALNLFKYEDSCLHDKLQTLLLKQYTSKITCILTNRFTDLFTNRCQMIEINIQELKWKMKDDIYKCYYLVVIIITFKFFLNESGKSENTRKVRN
jgi:hypothetical protein